MEIIDPVAQDNMKNPHSNLKYYDTYLKDIVDFESKINLLLNTLM